jgi:hypothetical protein
VPKKVATAIAKTSRKIEVADSRKSQLTGLPITRGIRESIIQHHCFQMLFWCMFILSPLDYCVSSWSCSSTKIAILSTTAVGRTRTSPPTSDILTGCMCVWCALSNPGRIACVDCVENSVCVLRFSLVSSRAEKSTSDKLTRNREYLAVQVSRKYPW